MHRGQWINLHANDRQIYEDTSVKRAAIILIDPETGEYYLSCPTCDESRDLTISKLIVFISISLVNALVFLRRIQQGSTSGFCPRDKSSYCSHIPLIMLNQYRSVFITDVRIHPESISYEPNWVEVNSE